jgi:hypothetical protein
MQVALEQAVVNVALRAIGSRVRDEIIVSVVVESDTIALAIEDLGAAIRRHLRPGTCPPRNPGGSGIRRTQPAPASAFLR